MATPDPDPRAPQQARQCEPHPPCTFRELLGRVEAAHTREITRLRQEIRRLSQPAEGPCHAALGDILPSPSPVADIREHQNDHPEAPLDKAPHVLPSEELLEEHQDDLPAALQDAAPGIPSPEKLLRISIIDAQGLDEACLGPDSGLCCTCTIHGESGAGFVTQVVSGTSAPTWNYDAVVSSYAPGSGLDFDIKSHGSHSCRILGRATLPSSAFDEEDLEGNLELQLHDGSPSGAFLHVSVEVREKRATFKPRPAWLDSVQRTDQHSSYRSSVKQRDSVVRAGDEAPCRASEAQRWMALGLGGRMLHPESLGRRMWSTLATVTVVMDLIWIPVTLMSPQEPLEVRVLSYWALIFWSLDIVMNFRTGFFARTGEVVMDSKQVGFAYLRTSLPLDLLIVGIDCSVVIQVAASDMTESSGSKRVTSVFRVIRVLRMLKLSRLLRLAEINDIIRSLISSEQVTIMFMVFRDTLGILFLVHTLACLWFAVGESQEDGWVPSEGLSAETLGLKYAVAMQWAISQFTPGSSPLQARTMPERVYSIMVLILALIVATCFVSNITSALSAMWSMTRYETMQAMLLKKFLTQSKISRNLAARVRCYVARAQQARARKLHPSKIHYLSYLSGPLNAELQSELRGPQLCVHSFFLNYRHTSPCLFQDLCTTALEQISFAKKDILFHRKQEAKHMYFVIGGSLAYSTPQRKDKRQKTRINEGQWACEHALWMPWQHAGMMLALSEVDVTLLNITQFCALTSSDSHLFKSARGYARAYLETVSRAASFHSILVTDLPLEVGIIGKEAQTVGSLCASARDKASTSFAGQKLREADDDDLEVLERSGRFDFC